MADSSSKQMNREKFKRTQIKKSHHKDQKSAKKSQSSTKTDGKKGKTNDGHDDLTNKLLSQLDCRFADISDDDEAETGKAFEDLVNAPVSTSSFVFKSEKTWTYDVSQFHDFFSVDVNQLATIFNCIPFTEYVEVDEEYLNRDDLTSIYSRAEQAKREYLHELEQSSILEKSKFLEQQSLDPKNETIIRNPHKHCNNAIDAEEDLDFLLSLKEPVRVLSTNLSSSSSRAIEDPRGKIPTKPTKSIDLEKWLDSVLDD